jgi:hypothetical protein
MRWLVISLVAACSGNKSEPAGNSPAPPITPDKPAPSSPLTGPVTCEPVEFAESTPVPEASGAAWLTPDSLLVISDSGNKGAYAIVDAATGKTIEQGVLPIGSFDDLEGVAMRGARVIAVTSPGWILEFERAASGFTLAAGPYALGPIDLPDRDGGLGMTPPEGDGMVCPEKRTNCGRNYEGICISPVANEACTGFVASKADGNLYCLVDAGGKLAIDRTRAVAVTQPGWLADCAYSEDGTLYAASNAFDAGRVYRFPNLKAEELAEMPVGFAETLAVKGDVFYRMSDAGDAPSTMKKYRCRPK